MGLDPVLREAFAAVYGLLPTHRFMPPVGLVYYYILHYNRLIRANMLILSETDRKQTGDRAILTQSSAAPSARNL